MDEVNKIIGMPIVSVLVGAGVTWLAAWWYYSKAGAELRDEAANLRKTSDLIIYCVTHPDADVEPQYDSSGHVTGLAVNMRATLTGSGGLTATATAPASIPWPRGSSRR